MRVEGDKSSSSPASAHQFTTNTPSTHFHALPRTSIEAHMNDDAGCQPVARLLLTLPCVPPALRVCSSPSKIQREEANAPVGGAMHKQTNALAAHITLTSQQNLCSLAVAWLHRHREWSVDATGSDLNGSAHALQAESTRHEFYTVLRDAVEEVSGQAITVNAPFHEN
ncbi:hypothetical protein TcWFU_005459 [Taenia crassiceps]|uniref:Uncharacterized protein n=1 Tax=Taenia crassiceps TaxID=6207 RepID=A0ABR4QB34_9CEST